MTAHIIKLQKASKVNIFLTYSFFFSCFGGVYSTFIDVTRFSKSKNVKRKVENKFRKTVENVLKCIDSIRQATIYYNMPCKTLRRYITEASKKQKRGDDISMVRDQIQLHGVKRSNLRKTGFVVFVTGTKTSVYTNHTSLARQEPCHSTTAMQARLQTFFANLQGVLSRHNLESQHIYQTFSWGDGVCYGLHQLRVIVA